MKKLKHRTGIVFYGALVWSILGEISEWVGFEKDKPHLNHAHGAPVRDFTTYLPIFILRYSLAGAVNEEREEGQMSFQAAIIERKLR